MTKPCNGKTALVTGGSRGIGKAAALALARAGANLVINYTSNDEKAAQVKQEIEALGQGCILAKTDLTQETCAQELQKYTRAADILILNASIQYRKNWKEITPQEFDTQIKCNLKSALLLIQAYVPAMQEKHWGRVVTIGSVQETKPHPDMLVYSASKAALSMMAKSLAVQLARDGVTVNSVAPGVIRTDRNVSALADAAYCQKILDGIPAGYCGTPRDCAEMIAFLCTDSARYITGQNIYIDGGMSNQS